MFGFAAGKSEIFLGGAVSSRLKAFIERTPALASLVSRLRELQHGTKAENQLKTKLTQAIREGRHFDADIEIDDTASLEFAIALHSDRKIEEMSRA